MSVEHSDDPQNELRRQWLVQALRLGLFGATIGAPTLQAATRSDPPQRMPQGQSIYRIDGDVRVNRQRANLDTIVRPGDEVQTGQNSRVIFVVGTDAYHLRAQGRVQLAGSGALVSALRLLSGGLLSVFGKHQSLISTPLATLGIRGTGVYAESFPDLSYLCTCYGETDLSANDDPTSRESILSEHHDAPRYVVAEGGPGMRIRTAPFINHDDDELMLLETLVGREPPFAVFGDVYGSPRRTY
jgi:hypothetical protein